VSLQESIRASSGRELFFFFSELRSPGLLDSGDLELPGFSLRMSSKVLDLIDCQRGQKLGTWLSTSCISATPRGEIKCLSKKMWFTVAPGKANGTIPKLAWDYTFTISASISLNEGIDVM
jgi:hypothetical protein